MNWEVIGAIGELMGAAASREQGVYTSLLKSALADRYAIERELGAGGMTTAYFALGQL